MTLPPRPLHSDEPLHMKMALFSLGLFTYRSFIFIEVSCSIYRDTDLRPHSPALLPTTAGDEKVKDNLISEEEHLIGAVYSQHSLGHNTCVFLLC